MAQEESKLLLERLSSLDFVSYVEMAKNLTKINMLNVEDTLKDQATIYAYYGGLETEAKRREDEIKDEIELFEATTHTEYRDGQASAVRKATAKDIEAYVLSRPKYVELKKNLAEASFKRSLLTKLLRALEHRKDMAVQISSKLRKEMDLTR